MSMEEIKHLDFDPEGTEKVNAWAATLRPGFQEIEIEPQFRGKSSPNMCPDSTDEGRHHWYQTAVLSQSITRDECYFCHEISYD